MKRFTFSLLAAAVLGLAAYALADAEGARRGLHNVDGGPAGFFQERGRVGGPGGPGRGHGRGGAMFALRGLDLTDDQKAQIREIHEAERQAQPGPLADLELHRQLQAAIFADAPDQQRIAALQQQLAQAESARLSRRIAIEQKVAQVLTAEQRAQVRERLAKGPRAR